MEYPCGYVSSINGAKIVIEAGFDLKNRLKVPLNLKKIEQLNTHFMKAANTSVSALKIILKGSMCILVQSLYFELIYLCLYFLYATS